MRSAKWSINRFTKAHRGFSLVELSIVLIIGVALIAVALKVVPSMLTDSHVAAEAKELPMIMTRVQRMFANRPNYTGLGTALAISNNVFPSDRVVNATTVNNQFGGTITTNPATLITTADAAQLIYTSVPEDVCKELIPQVESYMRIIDVNGTSVKQDGQISDLTAIGTQCTSGGSNNTITYTFGR